MDSYICIGLGNGDCLDSQFQAGGLSEDRGLEHKGLRSWQTSLEVQESGSRNRQAGTRMKLGSRTQGTGN